jgi:hypothetical protein
MVADAVRPVLERMLSRAGMHDVHASRFWTIFDILTRESLDFKPGDAIRRFSGICRDGTPWQFCASLGSQRPDAIRFLTEVGSPSAPLSQRTALTLARLDEVFELIDLSCGREQSRIIAGLCPTDDEHMAALWIGFAMDCNGGACLHLYANNGWGDAETRWLRLIGALRQLKAGGFGASLQPLLPLLIPVFSPAGFAVTLPPSPPVCKLYLRPFAEPWSTVRVLAQGLLSSGSDTFLGAIEDGFERALESVPPRALILSTSGSAAGGSLDLKLDLCGHCLFKDDFAPVRAVERLGQAVGLDTSAYHTIAEDLGAGGAPLPREMVAFVGVGKNAAAESRINVYLTPPLLDRHVGGSGG